MNKKERKQAECECEWVAIDGGVNRRLTTEEWKTLGEALWCVRRVNQATSTGMLGPSLSLSLSLSRLPSLSFSPLFHSLVLLLAWQQSAACLYHFSTSQLLFKGKVWLIPLGSCLCSFGYHSYSYCTSNILWRNGATLLRSQMKKETTMRQSRQVLSNNFFVVRWKNKCELQHYQSNCWHCCKHPSHFTDQHLAQHLPPVLMGAVGS